MEVNPNRNEEVRMSPALIGIGALDAMIAAQAAYAVHDYRKHTRRKK
jgi:hypothetical protein